jgi:hypothetical protein
MYYCAEFATPKYDRIRGNPLSRSVLHRQAEMVLTNVL